MKHRIGYKLLRDSDEFYLCLLEATGNVVANDIKYRTNEIYIHQIIKINNLKNVKTVNHDSFYDNKKIKYIVNQNIVSKLNYSSEICAEGIHYFPITGSFPEHFFTYFHNCKMNIFNVSIILESWISQIRFIKKYY